MNITKFLRLSTLSIASALTVTSFVFSSCSNDDDNDIPNNPSETEEFNDAVGLVFSYDKFITPEDVEITSQDTTEITVSKAFLESQGIKLKKNAPVCIWRTINTAPFIRIIESFTDNNNEVKLITKAGDMGDMFQDTDLEMNTELYVNKKESPTLVRTRGGNSVEGVNPNRYMDDDNVLHPAVIIVEDDDSQTRAINENTAFTAEDLLADNASFKFLNLHINNINKEFKIDEKGNMKFFIKNFYFNAESNLNLNASVKWFKLKSFECSINGYVESGITTGVDMKWKDKIKKEADIYNIPAYTAVFWAGPVPVAVKMNAGLKFKSQANASAECYASASASFRADYRAGVYYGGNWSPIHEANVTAKAGLDSIRGEVKVDATAGIYLKGSVMLYGCGGPSITLGPNVSSSVDAVYKYEGGKNTLNVKSNGSVALDGNLTASLNIWKWSIGNWGKDFTIWKKELWNVNKTYNF